MGSSSIFLPDLEVLALDAQTSGATPRKGRLIEVGWAPVVAGSQRDNPPETHLLCLPEKEALPPAVSKLTGIQPDELTSAPTPGDVWPHLAAAAGQLRERTGRPCLAVIHYARFERPFLECWHADCAPDSPFPFEILCTHAVARRLLPGLPRCGLRALAGYFGEDVGPLKRCAPHVAATGRIWQRLVALLADAGVSDTDALKQWLRAPSKPAKPARVYPMPVECYRRVPADPGVYRFRRAGGDLLYIGKAKSLKHRVGSYFQRRRRHAEHILEMLTQAVGLDYAATDTVLEAALREAQEIRSLAPPYNIQLQASDCPPVFSSRDLQRVGRTPEDHLPLGPFPSREALLPLATLVRCLSRPCGPVPDAEPDILAALGLPVDRQPPAGLLAEALALFCDGHALSRAPRGVARRLLHYGALWWRWQRAEDRDADGEAAEDTAGEPSWTPDRMYGFLQDIVSHGAFLVRRGRWFTMLCESALTWEKPSEGGWAATLTVCRGQVQRIASLPRIALPQPPRGHALPSVERKRCCDAATYARLRVLTTEIKRLVSEGRRVRLSPRPGVVFDEQTLGRLLFWV